MASTLVGRDAHHDRPLSQFAVQAFQSGRDQFVAQNLFPIVNVTHQNDRYYTIDKGSWLSINDTRRSRSSPANRVEWRVSSDQYYADNYALAVETPIEDLENADAVLRARRSSTNFAVEQLMRDLEDRVASKVTSIDNVGSGATLSGNDKWTATESADIHGQVSSAQAFIQSNTGLEANVMVVDWESFQLMRRNSRLLELFRYTSGGQLGGDQLRELFNVDRIIVGRGVKNVAEESDTTSMQSIWGSNAVLAHVNPNVQDMRATTFGLGLRWRPQGVPTDMQVMRSREDMAGSRHVEIIEAGYYQDEKIVAPELAYAITATR